MVIKSEGNNVWCEKCQNYFFSLILARTGKYPIECPKCKSYKYWEKKRSEVKTDGIGVKADSQDQ